MTKVLHRIHTNADLKIRSDGDGRTIHGLLMPFDRPTRISNTIEGTFVEIFRRGSFARTINEAGRKVRLQVLHDERTRLPIGASTVLTEDTDGLRGAFRVSKTRQGDEVLELIRDQALTGFSIGFRSISDRKPKPGVIERIEVALHEVSVVASPAYDDARVAGVRSLDPPFIPVVEASERLAAITAISPTEAARRLHQLQRN